MGRRGSKDPAQGERGWRRAISVMFMTFIAVCILSAAFITMYLYLTQHGLSATEAQRIYAEAAQERLQALLDRRAGEIIVNNTGGIGIALKYLVCLKRASNTALIQELQPLVIVPSGGGAVIAIPSNFTCSYPSEELYVMSERGNMFRALPGGFSFEIEASPANVTLSRGGSAEITLKLRAMLLETPENGVILIVADPSACRMTNVTTVTRIANITYTTMTLIGGRKTSVVTVCTSQFLGIICYWGTITYIADPTTVIAANVSVSYTTETMTRVNDFIAQPEPITPYIHHKDHCYYNQDNEPQRQELRLLGPIGLMLCLVQGYERDGRQQARRGRGKGAGRTGHYNDHDNNHHNDNDDNSRASRNNPGTLARKYQCGGRSVSEHNNNDLLGEWLLRLRGAKRPM